MSAPMFEFEMVYVDRPDDPYYFTNWDNKTPVTVIGATKAEALQNLWAMLGPAPPRRHWVAQTLRVRQITPVITTEGEG